MNSQRLRPGSRAFAAGFPAGAIIIAGGLLASLWIWFGLYQYIQHVKADKIAEASAANVSLAKAFNEHVLRLVKDVDLQAQIIVADVQRNGLANVDLEERQRKLAAALPFVIQITAIDASGYLASSSIEVPRIYLGDREQFAAHARDDSGKLFIARPVVWRNFPRLLIPMTRRLHDASGAFGGVLTMAIDPQYFSDFYATASSGAGFVALLRGDGIVLARSPGRPVAVGQDLSNTRSLKMSADKKAGFYVSDGSISGTPAVIAFDSVSEYGLSVRVGRPLDEVLAGVRGRLPYYYFAAAAMTILLLSGALAVAWQLAQRKRDNIAIAAGKAQAEHLLEENRKVLHEVEQAREKYRSVIAAMAEGVVVRDENARIVDCNASAERILGRSLDQLRGQRYFDRDWQVCNEDGSPVREEERTLNMVLRTGQAQSGVVKGFRKPDGSMLWLSANAQPLFDKAGTSITGIVTTITDISERKRAEEIRGELEAQLREAQKMEAIGTLAGGIAHDFNNILAAILGNAALARKDVGGNAAAQVSLEEINKAAVRAKNLVQQILAFSRRHPQNLVSQKLQPLVEETLGLLRATLPAGVELTATLGSAPLHVRADATQIQQVLMNLCTNAWHALEGDAGRIEVGVDSAVLGLGAAQPPGALEPGRYARLWVSDNGCGMDEATQARIFEPFFTTQSVDKGTGLGMAVVHGIVQAHQGAIQIESAPGKGTTVEVYLPAVDPPREQVQPVTPAAPARASGAGRHVLYVDDDEAMVFLVTRLLRDLGYRVSGYERAQAALEAVRAGSVNGAGDFDLAVTDYNMPGLSGLDMARELARLRPELPVVITSGYITEELQAGALAAGVRQVVYKPNTVEELCQSIQRLLDSAETGAREAAPK